MWAFFLLILAIACISVLLITAPTQGAVTTDNRMEPLTLHAIFGLWDDGPMPDSYQENLEGWKALGWNVRVWNKPEVEALIQSEFPEDWDMYQTLPKMGQKTDWARYFILYHLGGFYTDCDCKPNPKSNLLQRIKRPLDRFYSFIEDHITKEQAIQVAKNNAIRKGVPEIHGARLANYFFGCPARHPALKKVMDLARQRCKENPVDEGNTNGYLCLYCTGPCAFTTALHGDRSIIRWEHKKDFIHTCSHAWLSRNAKRKQKELESGIQ